MVTHQGGDMVNENIISMAVEAWGEGHEIFWFDDDGLERFFAFAYAAGATAERESCAQIAEEWLGPVKDRELHIAAAIRARSDK